MRNFLGSVLWIAASCFATSSTLAGEFDAAGNYTTAPTAAFAQGFESNLDPAIEGLTVIQSEQAIEGASFARIAPTSGRQRIRVPISLPATQGSYRATVWARSGAAQLTLSARYSSSARTVAELNPTGRCTSDGWVEMVSGELPVDGERLESITLSIGGTIDLDALELVASGEYEPLRTCKGFADPVCGRAGLCIDGGCVRGDLYVPPLPEPDIRERAVDWFQSRLSFYFGGHKTRARYLPSALATLEQMRSASTAWEFWSTLAKGVRQLHDWHTSTTSLVSSVGTSKRLNACFIEAEADLSQLQWPRHPRFHDIVVSHTGADDTAGLVAGDRLVAVDGLHPFEWVESLQERSWDWWQADDESVYGEYAERLRALIAKYARTFSILRCDAGTMKCAKTPEVIEVANLTAGGGSDWLIQCDNRPSYHLVSGPDETTHDAASAVYASLLKDSAPGENIYGMVWDSLWGPAFTPTFKSLNEQFRTKARGLILDHRAGNGGTLDAAEAITELVRPTEDIAIFIYERPTFDFAGPSSTEEGLAIFDRYKTYQYSPDLTFTVGSSKADTSLPVALLLHRDGSASDYLALGMKGAPKVKLFGPHRTAGAFSSYFNLIGWGAFSLQIATGESIGNQGFGLIGHGVEPDEIVLPKQSDLLLGQDTVHNRALAWVRSELKP